MEIIVAENAGFCFGVNRAVEKTLHELEDKTKEIYSYGPLIHNNQAVENLENKGLHTIYNLDDVKSGKIIIRSHGLSKDISEEILNMNLELVDCTCPYVLSIHKKVEQFSKKGYDIVIIGDKNHPEIIGINSYCENKAYIINTEDEAYELPYLDRVCLVSQTTNTMEKFKKLTSIVEIKSNNIEVFNTICNATKIRQESALKVAQMVNAMIVIGGKHSSNTQKLVEISRKYCDNVYHIETIKDLSLQEIQKFNKIGITAGASTPSWLIKEAILTMDNLNKDEMMEAIESSFTKIHRGDIIKGTILYVTENELMININYKSDGIVAKSEASNDDNINLKEAYKVGDEIDVYVLKFDDGEGNVVLSIKRVDDLKVWDDLEEIFKNKETIECKVINVVKGGLIALAKGINAFIPASHVSVNYVSKLDGFKGKNLMVRIIDIDRNKKRIILSRKEVEKEELEVKKAELWENLVVDDIVTGVVQRLTDFGAFVDLGGVDGLIHISDLSWLRVKHPSDVLKVGDKVEVKILALDKEKNRISLGLKQTLEEPWEIFKRNVSEGDTVEGKVVNLLDFGAFIRLKEGVDGLLHVSQISKEHVNKPSDVLKVGDIIKVKVIEINDEDRRISLSTKDESTDDEEVIEETKPEKNDEIIKNEEFDTTVEDIINNNK